MVSLPYLSQRNSERKKRRKKTYRTVAERARAREEKVAVAVERDSHHAVRQVEGLLDAVAMVDVDVDVEDAELFFKGNPDASAFLA